MSVRTPLGPIVRLQVQPAAIKVGQGASERYDPTRLALVPRLRLTPRGAVGVAEDGSTLPDVHHADHPETRYRGENPLSFALTGTYAALNERFGAHMADGCAGENILVDAALPVPTHRQLAIQSSNGALVRLHDVLPATPCLPFARHALANPHAEPTAVKAALQFLNNGGRGYYFLVTETVEIALGDLLVAL